MSVLIFLCVVVGVLFISYYINKQECSKGEVDVVVPTRTNDINGEASLEKKVNVLIEKLNFKIREAKHDTFLFRNIEFDNVQVYNSLKYVRLSNDKCRFTRSDKATIANSEMTQLLEEWYHGFSNKELKFLEDFINEATPMVSSKEQLRQLLVSSGIYCLSSWVEIGNWEYYTDNPFEIYRLSDLKTLCGREALEAIKGKEIKPCEDPKKVHWEHFLELEMKAKKKRESDCHKFVDSILEKQVRYNDLQLKYEMLPSAPIVDIDTFKNFCKLVCEYHTYEDYEIQNYLFLKRTN